MKILPKLAIGAGIVALVTGCSEGQVAFRTAEICVKGEEDLLALIRELEIIAHDNKLEFSNSSERTMKELDALGQGRDDRFPVLNVGIHDQDGMGLTAGNLGLSSGQIGIGFTEGKNSTRAHRFSQAVIDKLNERWSLTVYNGAKGVKNSDHCQYKFDRK